MLEDEDVVEVDVDVVDVVVGELVDEELEVEVVEVVVVEGCVDVEVVVAGGGGPALLVPLIDPTYALKLYF